MKSVNVINTINGVIEQVYAFRETCGGNVKAEKLFKKLVLENEAREQDLESYLDDGYYQNDGHELSLVHSG